MSKQQPTSKDIPSKISTKTFLEQFKESEDMQTFYKYKSVAGNYPQVEKFTPQQERDFTLEFNVWIDNNKPAPEMPAMKANLIPIPSQIYRVKHLGKQYLWYNLQNGGEVGREHVPILDSDRHVVGEDIVYTIPYTKAEAERLLQEAQDKARTPSYGFEDSTHKYHVSAEDFTKDDFDSIIKMHRKKEYVN